MICEKCGQDKPDVMRRADIPNKEGMTATPALCTECCAEIPGREWMKAGLQK